MYPVLSFLRLISFKILNDMTFGTVFNCKKKIKKKLNKKEKKKRKRKRKEEDYFHFKWNGKGILSAHDFYASIVIDFKALMSLISYLGLLHSYHDKNQTTDFLAKLGYS